MATIKSLIKHRTNENQISHTDDFLDWIKFEVQVFKHLGPFSSTLTYLTVLLYVTISSALSSLISTRYVLLVAASL